jgi:hypothetical protein
MNMIKIATGLLIILISALGDAAAVQDELVARVQSVSADLVDPVLPHIPLQEWIKAALGSGAAIVWERSDCDLKSVLFVAKLTALNFAFPNRIGCEELFTANCAKSRNWFYERPVVWSSATEISILRSLHPFTST